MHFSCVNLQCAPYLIEIHPGSDDADAFLLLELVVVLFQSTLHLRDELVDAALKYQTWATPGSFPVRRSMLEAHPLPRRKQRGRGGEVSQ